MAFSVNKVILLGNLSRDVDLQFTQNGTPIATVNIATNRSIKKGDVWQDVASFHRIKVFGKMAEFAAKAPKGTKVYIEGSLQYGEYEKEGVKRYTTDIVAREFIPMTKIEGNNDNYQAPTESEINIDDIPF